MKEKISLILVLGIVGVLVVSLVIDSRASAVPVMEEVDVVDVMDKLREDKLERLEIKETKSGEYAFKSLDDEIIEIGTEENSPSTPYLKLNKWDGEVSLKVNVPYVMGDKPDKSEDNKLKWSNNEYDVTFYPKEPEEISEIDSEGDERTFTINDEGGVEFDLILREKPETNVFAYPIESENLDYFYQPPLNESEKGNCSATECIDENGTIVTYRPEHVVGSYAVYHKTKMNNEYKTGKAFHIYRPRVYDANGNWIWGELNIDEEKGILTVIVDQNWLDSAVYPVVIDPNFGYTTLGASEFTLYTDKLSLRIGNPGEDGTATSISLGARISSGSSAAWQGGLYNASLGLLSPRTATGVINSATKQWWTLNFTNGPSVSNANFYVAAFLDYDSSNKISNAYDTGGVSGDSKYNEGSYTYNTWPGTYSGNNSSSRYSLYATYAPPANNAPTISSVTDSPDPVEDGNNVTFSVDWNDADAEGIKMYVCKENDGGASGCGAGGTWCSNSNDYDLTDPITCSYTTQSGDLGPKNFYVHVTDDEPSYSSAYTGSVTIDPVLKWVTVWVDDETGYGVGEIEVPDIDYTYQLVDEWWIGLDWESISDYDDLLAATPSLIEDFETSYALYETVENVLAEEYFQDNIDWYPGYGPPDLPPYEPVVSFWFTGEALDKHIMYGHDQSGDVMFEGFVLGKQNDRPRCDFVMEVEDWVGIGIECVVDYLGDSLRAICWIGE